MLNELLTRSLPVYCARRSIRNLRHHLKKVKSHMFNVTEEKAKDVVKGLMVPPQPEVLLKIQQLRQNEKDFSVKKLADLISTDVGISAFVLKTINSPIYGFNKTVVDIVQAAMLLGVDNVVNLVTFYEYRQAMLGKPSCISMERYWDTSLDIAALMSLTVERLNMLSRLPKEYAYSAGLFHNCGLPVLSMHFNDYQEILRRINEYADHEFTELEDDSLNTNHAIVGYFVARSWHFPEIICQFILMHHEHDLLTQAGIDPQIKDLFALLKICDNVMSKHRRQVNDNEWSLVQEAVLSHFVLSDDDYQDLESFLLDELGPVRGITF